MLPIKYTDVDVPSTANINALMTAVTGYIKASMNISVDIGSPLSVTPYFSDGQEYKQINGKLRTSSVPYTYDIVEGNIAGHSSLFKFGSNPDVGTSEETIWQSGGLYPWAAVDLAAGIVKISSTDVDDTHTTGTGVRTVTIYGLSSVDSTEINETVSLTGQTPVNSTLSYYRVNRMICNTAGTTMANEGIIYVGTGAVSSGVPAVKWSTVAVGKNQTLQSIWTVPAGKMLFVTSFFASTNSNKGTIINIYVRPPSELFQIKANVYLFSTAIAKSFDFPLVLQAGTDIDCRAIGTASSGGIQFSFEGWTE